MSASRDDDAPDCALCERKATSRCSACKNIWFCSAQCQTTLWPVHKSLCKADQSIFRQAPLTPQELADIDALADELYNTGSAGPFLPYTVRQALTAASALEDWSEVLDLLGSPTTTDPRPSHRIDDVREFAIMMSRVRLAHFWEVPDEAQPPHVNTPWSLMVHHMSVVTSAYAGALAQGTRAVEATTLPRTELNVYLRQVLILYTVAYQVRINSTSTAAVAPWLPLQFLARDRAVAALDKSNIDPRIVAQLRPFVLDLYAESEYLVEREDGTMPPAVHP